MSLTTRPPGDVGRPATAQAPSAGAGAPPATAGATPVPPGGAAAPQFSNANDVGGALRVFLEEVRTAAQAQLTSAASSAPLPALADAEPGNAAAAVLRWLRAATADGRLPPAVVREIVETAHARTQAVLRGTAATRGAGAASGAMPADMDLPEPVRAALAYARDRVLQGVGAGDPRAAATLARGARADSAGAAEVPRGPVRTGEQAPSRTDAPGAAAASGRVAGSPDEAVATPAPPAARTRAVDARVPALEDGARTSGATPRASAEAVLRGGPPPVAAAAVPSRASTVAATAAPPSAGGAHTAAAATALLRTFVDAVRVELQRTLGASRLPSAPPPLVADAHGATLGPALLRWVTSAVAERGVPLAPLQEAVRSAHARVEASLAGSVASTPSGALDGLQDTLRSVRDHVLRGLGASVERSEAGVRPEPSSMRGDVRVDAPVADPRGIPLAGSALVPRDDRVEAVESRVPARHGESELALGDEPPGDTGATRDEGDLQGPMDCVRRYFEAFLAGDSHAYAQQWVYPACVWKDGRWSAYPTAAACARGNDDYTFAVRAQGAVGGRIVMLRAEPVTPDVAIVHGVFTRERADGRVLQEVEAAYTTVRTAEGWRVAVCIVK